MNAHNTQKNTHNICVFFFYQVLCAAVPRHYIGCMLLNERTNSDIQTVSHSYRAIVFQLFNSVGLGILCFISVLFLLYWYIYIYTIYMLIGAGAHWKWQINMGHATTEPATSIYILFLHIFVVSFHSLVNDTRNRAVMNQKWQMNTNRQRSFISTAQWETTTTTNEETKHISSIYGQSFYEVWIQFFMLRVFVRCTSESIANWYIW